MRKMICVFLSDYPSWPCRSSKNDCSGLNNYQYFGPIFLIQLYSQTSQMRSGVASASVLNCCPVQGSRWWYCLGLSEQRREHHGAQSAELLPRPITVSRSVAAGLPHGGLAIWVCLGLIGKRVVSVELVNQTISPKWYRCQKLVAEL